MNWQGKHVNGPFSYGIIIWYSLYFLITDSPEISYIWDKMLNKYFPFKPDEQGKFSMSCQVIIYIKASICWARFLTWLASNSKIMWWAKSFNLTPALSLEIPFIHLNWIIAGILHWPVTGILYWLVFKYVGYSRTGCSGNKII